MADTLRQQILAVLKTRAQAITSANGFTTDAGMRLEHGPYEGSTDDAVPLLRLMTAEAEPFVQDDVIGYHWPIYLVGVAARPDADPLDAAEVLLGDLKRALFLQDRTLDGVLKANRNVGDVTYGRAWTEGPVPGGTRVSAGVEIVVTFFEKYGDPDDL